MLSKILLPLLIAGVFQSSFADEAKKPEEPKTFKDKLILTWHSEHGFVRTNDGLGDIKDFTQFYNPTVGYKIGKEWNFTSNWEFKHADHKRPKFLQTANMFYRALFSLNHTNVLTEAVDGVKMDVGVARRYFDRQAVGSVYGNNRFTTTFTKNVGKHNGSLFIQYLENDPKDVGTSHLDDSDTWRRGVEIIPTINIQLTDKLSFTTMNDMNMNTPWFGGQVRDLTLTHEWHNQLAYSLNDIHSIYLDTKYDHGQSFKALHQTDDFVYEIGYTYAYTPKIKITPAMSSTILQNGDKRVISESFTKPEFTLYLDASF